MISTKGLSGVQSLYSRIVELFPQKFTFCFAYGSGVFKQLGSSDQSKNVIDIIFSVDNPSEWHRENIAKNRKHYSLLGWFGHEAVAKYQENWGAKVYFNTLVPIEKENAVIKYGVISHSALVTDLLDWNDLYLAGRLHKPVEIIRNASYSELRSALQQNLHSVVHAALLLLPDAFTEKKFYETIAGISYFGDFRMIFGEDKNKIENIVLPQIKAFWDLYAPVLNSMSDYVDVHHSDDGHQMCYQNFSPTARHYHLNQLPRTPQRAVVRAWNKGSVKYRQDTEDALHSMAFDPDCGKMLDSCIRDIVWSSSITQSLKGILTAGLLKSVKYSAKKVLKMYKSL
ncbi:phosphatidate cytidylyltransferase, mitochondrial [Bacillus rossius redtenbacheri]|uniref:phosphatidate cytidylyltransferase, mitochondrial n=1 Tax=Bacillus rossius redtenbacheri TaxID=93214 RepID=UPI002FDEA4EF